MNQTFIAWLLILGIVFPLLSILLGEFAEILERQKHPLANAIKIIRQYLLPPLAVLLVMRELLKIAKTEGSARIIESVTLLVAIFALVSLLGTILTTKKPQKFQVHVPNLFFQIARLSVILGIGYYLLTGVWGIDLAGLATALGVGSLVIALALQDTLSNLVSGLLLLIAKPFKIGDWIDVDGTQARVIDQNWWSVTLENKIMGHNIVIPNGTLASATISNYGQGKVWNQINVSFSYRDPPNKVIQGMNTLVAGIDFGKGIEPLGITRISAYENSSINYELWYQVLPEKSWLVHNQLISRIYYLAKRESFTIADADNILQEVKEHQIEMVDYLRSLSYFFTLNNTQIEQLASKSQFQVYGGGELITQEGQPDIGLYAVYQGRVSSSLTDNLGQFHIDKQFGIGDVFGEMALYPGEVSPITAIAEGDAEVVVIPAAEIVQLIQVNPKFASEIVEFIEERKKLLRIVKGGIDSMTSLT